MHAHAIPWYARLHGLLISQDSMQGSTCDMCKNFQLSNKAALILFQHFQQQSKVCLVAAGRIWATTFTALSGGKRPSSLSIDQQVVRGGFLKIQLQQLGF